MPLTIENFTLPTLAQVPINVRSQFVAGSFPTDVRNFHLERIPRMVIPSGTYILCPWCGKEKDSRSMQIDHIIPIQQYCRYKLLHYSLKNQDNRQSMLSLEKDLRILLKVLYSDTKNLLLCCVKCNSGEGNTMPTEDGLRGAAARVQGTVLQTRLLNLIPILQDIRRLRPIKDQGVRVDLWTFIHKGASWNTSPRDTRQSTSPATNPFKMLGKLSIIHNTVVDKLVRGRPAWSITAGLLVPFQPTRQFTDEEGRLCFYCLGLFKKQAFHIDHINPASRRADNATAYNDPTNLIPACRTCNTSKGDRYLSKTFLAEMLKARQDENLPGVEHVANPVFPGTYTSYLDYVADVRNHLLGL
ncbi:MAG TPA: HNH endonuclease [Terracidiphilus sp.]|nr:HNH endonuclease [Terracidiphilus sp.]